MTTEPSLRRPLRGPVRRLGGLVALTLAAALLPLGLPAGLSAAATGSGSASGSASEPRVAPSAFTRLHDLRLGAGDRVRVRPDEYTAYRLDLARTRATLATATTSRPVRIAIPGPDGRLVDFDVVEDSVMQAGLAARHPGIHTYAGHQVTAPARTIRLDVTPMGFHASVRGANGRGAWYVDPAYNRAGSTTHLSYLGAAVPPAEQALVERDLADTRDLLAAAPAGPAAAAAEAAPGDVVTRRTFRLAFVTDPSYAAYFNGKNRNVLSEKVTLINRVNQIYNDDLAIRFLLIDGSDKLNLDTAAKATLPNGPCGANPCYDPADLAPDAGCTSAVLTRNEFVLGQLVGADSYDIGHLGLGINGGGIAGLGVVGGANKASGCTGLPFPEGDFYAIDYVAHEVGHQMGGNHTFNGTQGNCSLTNRNGGTSVEPGSGSSVMAYAGICGQDDLQPHTDPYFSQRSIDEIVETTTAAPTAVNEVQTITLTGFEDAADKVTLSFTDTSVTPAVTRTTTIANDSSYVYLLVQNKINQLTGLSPRIAGYDGSGPTLSPDGFQLTFGLASGAMGVDVPRIAIASVEGGVQAFVGNQAQGGDSGNQGYAPLAQVTANHAPTVTAPADRTIPVRTPFTLTGTGTDTDAGTALTYLWEQNDAGSAAPTGGTALVSNTKADGPLFRVFATAADVSQEDALTSPSPGENLAGGNPSRTFPDLAQILAGNTNAATGACPAAPADTAVDVPAEVLECYSEFLPTADYGSPLTGGVLNFRLTARDGFATGGGTAYDDVALTVDPAAGPFLVSSRAEAGDPAVGGTKETLTWEVAGTDAEALAPNVRISVSTDGGQTFPHVLEASTPNDGTEEITWPSLSSEHARIRIEAVDNYFFDLNDADFSIEPGSTTPAQTQITGGTAPNEFLLKDRTTVTFTSSVADSTFRCTLDRKAVACADGKVVLKDLTNRTHRFSVAAVTPVGVVDPTPAVIRFANPVDDDQLKRVSGKWKAHQDAAAYGGDYLSTGAKGATLSFEAKRATRIALVVGTDSGNGSVAVFFAGQRIATVKTSSAKPRVRVLLPVRSFANARSGLLEIRTLSAAPVRIEGLGIFSR